MLTATDLLSRHRTPAPAASEVRMATDPQMGFIRNLIAERDPGRVMADRVTFEVARSLITELKAMPKVATQQLPLESEISDAGWVSDLRGNKPAWPGSAESEAKGTISVTIPVTEGYYTIVQDGGHVTFRIRRQRKDSTFRPGELLISYLSGPVNTSDYTRFGHAVESDGQVTSLVVWKRFRDSGRLIEGLKVLAGDPKAAAKSYALESGCCAHCGLTLTTPESIERGYGPDCWARGYGQ